MHIVDDSLRAAGEAFVALDGLERLEAALGAAVGVEHVDAARRVEQAADEGDACYGSGPKRADDWTDACP